MTPSERDEKFFHEGMAYGLAIAVNEIKHHIRLYGKRRLKLHNIILKLVDKIISEEEMLEHIRQRLDEKE